MIHSVSPSNIADSEDHATSASASASDGGMDSAKPTAAASSMPDIPDHLPAPDPCPAQEPKPLPDVKMPSAAEIARHSLTHIPYRRWCRWCVMARMPNMGHYKLPPFSRSIPFTCNGVLLFEVD